MAAIHNNLHVQDNPIITGKFSPSRKNPNSSRSPNSFSYDNEYPSSYPAHLGSQLTSYRDENTNTSPDFSPTSSLISREQYCISRLGEIHTKLAQYEEKRKECEKALKQRQTRNN